MARAEKVAAVAELTERFQTSAGAVLTEYRGLTVAQLGELRLALGDNATFAVVKNTLTKLAASEAGIADELSGLLSGPSAIAFVRGDVVEAAKGLRDFSKAYPFLVIKGGVLEGKSMTPDEITRLAGAMKASLSGAAATMAALPVQMARLLAALQAKLEEAAPAPEEAAPAAEAAAPAAEAAAPAAEEAAPGSEGAAPDGEAAASADEGGDPVTPSGDAGEG